MKEFDVRQLYLATGEALNKLMEKEGLINELECLNEEMCVEVSRVLKDFAWEQRALMMESTADKDGFLREMKELEQRRKDELADMKERYEMRLTELRDRIDEMERELQAEIQAYEDARKGDEEGGAR